MMKLFIILIIGYVIYSLADAQRGQHFKDAEAVIWACKNIDANMRQCNCEAQYFLDKPLFFFRESYKSTFEERMAQCKKKYG